MVLSTLPLLLHAHKPSQAIADVSAQGLYPGPIVTELVPLTKLWPGEAYHQDYYSNNPTQGYCRAVVAPKVGRTPRVARCQVAKPPKIGCSLLLTFNAAATVAAGGQVPQQVHGQAAGLSS